MSEERLQTGAAVGLVIGAVLGTAGSFAPSAELRGLAWGVDGIALVVASALLVVHHLRHGNGQLAAGFLVFLAGETLIVSGSAMDLAASAPSFGAGAGLWSAALALVSASPVMPRFVRATGAMAAVLFAVTADLRRGRPDAPVQAVAILCLSVPGRHAARMGLGELAAPHGVTRGVTVRGVPRPLLSVANG
jgi:hypothetical protein